MYRTSVHVQYHTLAFTYEGIVSETHWNRGGEIARLTREGIEGYTSIHTGRVALTVSMEDGPVPSGQASSSTILDRLTVDQAHLHILTWGESYDPIVLPNSFVGSLLTVQWSATQIPQYWDSAAPPTEHHHVAIWRTDTLTA